MNDPDLSTKLKLMGVDVASFGDYFADERMTKAAVTAHLSGTTTPATSSTPSMSSTPTTPATPSGPSTPPRMELLSTGVSIATIKPSKKRGLRDTRDDPIKCLTYHDPFSSTYKKYIFTADGQYLLGGIMIGDTGSFTKMVAIVKKKVCHSPAFAFPLSHSDR